MRPPRRPPGWPFSCRVEKSDGTRVASAFHGGSGRDGPHRRQRARDAVPAPGGDLPGAGGGPRVLLARAAQGRGRGRAVPDQGRDRPRWVRRGVRGVRPAAGADGSAQGPEAGKDPQDLLRGVDPEGGRGGRQARPPGHRDHLRRGDLPGGRVPRDGAAPGRDAGSADREGSAARGRGVSDRRADGGGAGPRPFTGRAAQGSETRERFRLRGRSREAARLRPGAPARDRGVERGGNAGLHGAGAGGRGGGRRAGGCLGGGDGAGGDADGQAAGGEDALPRARGRGPAEPRPN